MTTQEPSGAGMDQQSRPIVLITGAGGGIGTALGGALGGDYQIIGLEGDGGALSPHRPAN